MERRRSKRIIVHLGTELRIGTCSYPGFLENISENGTRWHRYLGEVEKVTDDNIQILSAVNFPDGTELQLTCRLPSGQILDLKCKVVWSHKVAPHGFLDRIGMKIVDPPSEFKEYLKNLG